MPKSSKKKKDKAADFSKAKLKLGKGKQTPSNAVDTSFKARSIALPNQRLAHEGTSETPTTKRKLSLEDLLGHLKHYNSSTRKDAIHGLKELLEDNPILLKDRLTTLVNNCVRLISDEDAGVRTTLLGFLNWLLTNIPAEDLIPHSPVLLLFATSAQTHIFPEIRIDAIRCLDLLLDHTPNAVVEGWDQQTSTHGRRVLEGYLGILNAGTKFGEGGDTGPVQATSTASVVLSPKSKLVVLDSLSRFLRRALKLDDRLPDSSSSSGHTPTPTWFFESSFSSNRAFTAFDSLIKPNCEIDPYEQTSSVRQWHPDVDFDNFEEDHIGRYDLGSHDIGNWAFQDLCELSSLQAGPSNLSTGPIIGYSGQSSLQHLTSTLHQILVSTFLDCAPVVFSPSGNPPETELNLIVAVSEIARCLYGNLSRTNSRQNGKNKDASQDLGTFLGYMSPYFPFTPHVSLTGKRDIKTEQAFQDLNVIFCELTSLQLLSSTDENRPTKSKSRATRTLTTNRKVTSDPRSTIPSPSQAERVGQYVIQLLQGGSGSGPGSHASLPRPLSSSAYNAILPTIWAILSNDGMSNGVSADALLTTLVDHAIRTSSASPVKKSTIDVLGRLILLDTEPEYSGAFRVTRSPVHAKKLVEWLVHLPKTLWELASNNLPASEVILRLILRLAQRKSSLLSNECSTLLRTRLVPFFIITHATRGKLPGPYHKLPTSASPTATNSNNASPSGVVTSSSSPTTTTSASWPIRRLVLDVAVTLVQFSSGSEACLTARNRIQIQGGGPHVLKQISAGRNPATRGEGGQTGRPGYAYDAYEGTTGTMRDKGSESDMASRNNLAAAVLEAVTSGNGNGDGGDAMYWTSISRIHIRIS